MRDLSNPLGVSAFDSIGTSSVTSGGDWERRNRKRKRQAKRSRRRANIKSTIKRVCNSDGCRSGKGKKRSKGGGYMERGRR